MFRWIGQAASLLGRQPVLFAIVWWLAHKTGTAKVLAFATLAALLTPTQIHIQDGRPPGAAPLEKAAPAQSRLPRTARDRRAGPVSGAARGAIIPGELFPR